MGRRLAVLLVRLIAKRNLERTNYEEKKIEKRVIGRRKRKVEKKVNGKSINKKKVEKKVNGKSINKKKIEKKVNGKSINKMKIEKKVNGKSINSKYWMTGPRAGNVCSISLRAYRRDR